MSFSSRTKAQIALSVPTSECCRRAMLSAMLVYGKICAKDKIKFITDIKESSELLLELLDTLYGVQGNLYVSEKKTPPEGAEDEPVDVYESYKITVPSRRDIARLSQLFVQDPVTLYRINRSLFRCPECRMNFAKGMFLASGTVTNPELSYHLEICTSHKNLAFETEQFLSSLVADAKITQRKSMYIIYYKKSDSIIDLLNLLQANRSAFEFINTQIHKNGINNVNRAVNCDTANIQRSVNAASEALEAIELLAEKDMLDALPKELKEAAYLRQANPDLSLRQLSELPGVEISKSGLNHRLQKIIALANKEKG